MKLLKLVTGSLVAISLVSCSNPIGALTSVLGSKPEVTAQAGASNIKQGVGLTSTADASSRAEASIKDSKVGSVDSSSGKKMSASSISAEIIRADTIQISNNDDDGTGVYKWGIGIAAALLSLAAGLIVGMRKQKKEAL